MTLQKERQEKRKSWSCWEKKEYLSFEDNHERIRMIKYKDILYSCSPYFLLLQMSEGKSRKPMKTVISRSYRMGSTWPREMKYSFKHGIAVFAIKEILGQIKFAKHRQRTPRVMLWLVRAVTTCTTPYTLVFGRWWFLFAFIL